MSDSKLVVGDLEKHSSLSWSATSPLVTIETRFELIRLKPNNGLVLYSARANVITIAVLRQC